MNKIKTFLKQQSTIQVSLHLQECQNLFNLSPEALSDHSGSNNHGTATNNFYLETVQNNTSDLDTDKIWNLLQSKFVEG